MRSIHPTRVILSQPPQSATLFNERSTVYLTHWVCTFSIVSIISSFPYLFTLLYHLWFGFISRSFFIQNLFLLWLISYNAPSQLLFSVCVRVTVLLQIFMFSKVSVWVVHFCWVLFSLFVSPPRPFIARVPHPHPFIIVTASFLSKSLIIFPSPSPIVDGPQISSKSEYLFPSVIFGSFLHFHIYYLSIGFWFP